MTTHPEANDGPETAGSTGAGEAESVRAQQGEHSKALQVLSSDECYRLLSTTDVGRIGVMVDGYPVIIPVNYALDRGVIVVRTHPGSTRTAANHANVTFEVDALRPMERTGWSVLVRGQGEIVTEGHHPDLVARTEASGASPWAPGDYTSWLRIIPHGISGRLIERTETDWQLGTAAYM